MKTRDFIGELLSYGTGFALAVLVITGLAIAMAVFLIVVFAAVFVNRILG
jgi:hypothetical protein